MTKEKMIKLEKYLLTLQQRLDSSVPQKHTNHPETYKRFLRNEISLVKGTIERAKLEGTNK